MIPTDSIKFKGRSCFSRSWVGVDPVKPINVIIGRNNSGKSQLLNLVELLCGSKVQTNGWQLQCHTKLDEMSLRSIFPQSTSGGQLRGNYWIHHGQHLIGRTICWEVHADGAPHNLRFIEETKDDIHTSHSVKEARNSQILKNIHTTHHRVLRDRVFRRLLADRDISIELPESTPDLQPDGSGSTNLIRKFIVTSNSEFPHELVQTKLLESLNEIFRQDAEFTDIQVKLHDDEKDSDRKDRWEIYLGESKKSLVSLSNSGSGLKTVILVLLNLLVIPEILNKEKSKFVFAFEELENNLHPSLLRNLLQFIETYTRTEGAIVFLTTHSSTTLDVFGISNNANIVHVTHDGESAATRSVTRHFDRLGVVSRLGARASDLLQANGIIWVEGPSDRIYLNRWIEILSKGDFQEGRHYQCIFYGGSLLARTQVRAPEDVDPELVNLFQANSNIVVVCDGDRSSRGRRIKSRVKRIRDEVKQIPNAHIWITDAREIENYIPGNVLSQVLGRQSVVSPGRYEKFFPRKGSRGPSFVQSKLGGITIDKVDLAIFASRFMEREDMETRFDWKKQMTTIVNRIEAWNK